MGFTKKKKASKASPKRTRKQRTAQERRVSPVVLPVALVEKPRSRPIDPAIAAAWKKSQLEREVHDCIMHAIDSVVVVERRAFAASLTADTCLPTRHITDKHAAEAVATLVGFLSELGVTIPQTRVA